MVGLKKGSLCLYSGENSARGACGCAYTFSDSWLNSSQHFEISVFI